MVSVRHALLSAVSVAALGLPASPLLAQDAAGTPATDQPSNSGTVDAPGPGTASAEIVVTGVRASLQSAQSIKRNAVSIVDTIAAEDIGKFPDNTVSDALQRVTGVQVARGAGEAGTVLVRGLPNVATLLNGRESFTGTARGVALQDIPAELIAGVDVYKTSTPDIVEGGVAGVIDIRLHRPFDFKGLTIAGGGRAVYSDQSGKWGYLGDGVVSDHWDTSIGEVGVLVGASYNRRRYQDNTAFDFVSNPATANGPGIPDTVGGIYGNGDRQRMAYNAALQWRPAPNLEFHADALYTEYKNTYNNDFFIALPKAGAITSITTYPDAPQLANSTNTTNAYTLSSQQAFKDRTRTLQADFGGKWTSGNVTLSSEVTYDHSKLDGRNLIVDTSFNAPNEAINFDHNGTPLVDITGVDLTNPANFTLRDMFDNHSESVSRQWAWRGDLVYDFDGGFLSNFKVGARYTNRRVSSQATASQQFNIVNPVLASSIDGFSHLSPNGLVQGLSGIGQFIDADPGFLLNNSDEVREIFGRPDGAPAYDPALAFFDAEKTYAVYGQVGYRFDIGSVPVDGVGGVRVVNTVEGLQGDGVSSRQNYVNVLPSINARLHLTDKLQLRLAYAKSVTRPDFAALNPLVSYTTTGTTGDGAVFYTGGGGNAALKPIKSTGYDASLEWYLNRTTSLTAAGFYRDLNGYIQTYSAIETYLGESALVSRPRNTGKGSLKGAELAYQQFFDFLPGPLSGLGAQLNGTFIIGKTADPINGGMERLVNVSKYSYNVVAIYEKYGISGRLAYNWRSSFVDSYNSGGVQAGTVVAAPTGQLDFSGSYAINEAVSLTFDATNLTNRVYHDRFKGINNASGLTSSTPRDTRTYDRTFEFGARFKF